MFISSECGFFYNYVNTKILKLFYPGKDFSYSASTHFQSTFPDENTVDGWVHQDANYMLTAIIYLNHCNRRNFNFYKER